MSEPVADMVLRAGVKVSSAVSAVQLVVVKAPEGAVTLTCGGEPMLVDADPSATQADVAAVGEGPALGKRYANDELGLEVLCAKAGSGALELNGVPLAMKGAKPLPSSD